VTIAFPELNWNGRRKLPEILAAENVECGLACLAMIGRYYGHDVDLNHLRQRFPVSMIGLSLRGLMTCADKLGFGTRALRADLEALRQVQLPAILHWDLDHFVVLKEARKAGIVIVDPSAGEQTVSWADASNHFTGVVLELQPASDFQPAGGRKSIRISSLWSEGRGLKSAVLQILVLSAALQVVVFAIPFQMQIVVDHAIARVDFELLKVVAIAFTLIFLIQTSLEALRSWAVQVTGQMLIYQMKGNLFRHLIHLSSDFFEKRHVGDIISRMGSSSAIQDAITRGVATAIIDGAMASIAVLLLFVYSWQLGLIVAVTVALSILISWVTFGAMRAKTSEQLITAAKEQSFLMESIRAAVTVKILGREAEREHGWRNLFAKNINSQVQLSRIQIRVSFAQNTINGLSLVLIVYLGAEQVLTGAGMSVGMLIAFLSFRQTFSDRMLSLISQGVQFSLIGLHLERLGDIVTAEREKEIGHVSAVELKGQVELRNVSFKYGSTDNWVLKDLDLTIDAGEFVAITGRSGTGKTTLMKLLLGLYPPTDGRITIDGQNLTEEFARTWRSQVGVVTQDDRLLSGSIADNIAFFDPDLDMARVTIAAQMAQIHDQIQLMPMQYLSLIGDMGSALSGGQRQRILLARAFYRQPKVLLLDEGTANLDEQTEKSITEIIKALKMTRIIVAHRPALLQAADRVVTL